MPSTLKLGAYDFNPWQLYVNVDLTKQLYKEMDYSTDKKANAEFIEKLSSQQQQFVNSLGVDLTKVEIDKTIYEIQEDEEVFGKNFPESIKVLSSNDEDYLKTFDNGIGAGIVFKHPCFHYDNEKFKEWDCGYILGTILIMQDI